MQQPVEARRDEAPRRRGPRSSRDVRSRRPSARRQDDPVDHARRVLRRHDPIGRALAPPGPDGRPEAERKRREGRASRSRDYLAGAADRRPRPRIRRSDARSPTRLDMSLLPGARALLAIHARELPQRDDLCGAFCGALALRAAGIEVHDREPLDQDAVALAAGSIVSALADPGLAAPRRAGPARLPPVAAARRGLLGVRDDGRRARSARSRSSRAERSRRFPTPGPGPRPRSAGCSTSSARARASGHARGQLRHAAISGARTPAPISCSTTCSTASRPARRPTGTSGTSPA